MRLALEAFYKSVAWQRNFSLPHGIDVVMRADQPRNGARLLPQRFLVRARPDQ